jgi:hypothetical protein
MRGDRFWKGLALAALALLAVAVLSPRGTEQDLGLFVPAAYAQAVGSCCIYTSPPDGKTIYAWQSQQSGKVLVLLSIATAP